MSTTLLLLVTRAVTATPITATAIAARRLTTTVTPTPGRRGQRGQSTAEYALVLLGAATVALVFLAWAGRTDRIGDLFDAVIDTVIGKV